MASPSCPPYGQGYYAGEFPNSKRVLIIPPGNQQQYRPAKKCDAENDKSSQSSSPTDDDDHHHHHKSKKVHVCDDLVKWKTINVRTSLFKVHDPCFTTCCQEPVVKQCYDPCSIGNEVGKAAIKLKLMHMMTFL